MKVIWPEKIIGISASSSKIEWPCENVLDDFRTHYWESNEIGSAKLFLDVAGGANAIAIFNCPEVDTIEIRVKVNDEIIFQKIYDLYFVQTYLDFFTNQPTKYPSLWAEYPYQANDHKLELTFTAINPENTIKVGVVRAGLGKEIGLIKEGLSEKLKDFSIIKELNSGAVYVRKRKIIRTFSGSINTTRNRNFYIFQDIYKNHGQKPLAIRLVDDNSQNWNIFGRFLPIGGSHANINRTEINFEIEEAI